MKRIFEKKKKNIFLEVYFFWEVGLEFQVPKENFFYFFLIFDEYI
jgi:hypothetical protein